MKQIVPCVIDNFMSFHYHIGPIGANNIDIVSEHILHGFISRSLIEL
jgi:hypothetical protein